MFGAFELGAKVQALQVQVLQQNLPGDCLRDLRLMSQSQRFARSQRPRSLLRRKVPITSLSSARPTTRRSLIAKGLRGPVGRVARARPIRAIRARRKGQQQRRQ